jgi:hypothetical protein
MEKDLETDLKNADFKKITKILEVTVHNFSISWALFWALFEHFLAIFASTFLGFYQRNRERPSPTCIIICFQQKINLNNFCNFHILLPFLKVLCEYKLLN